MPKRKTPKEFKKQFYEIYGNNGEYELLSDYYNAKTKVVVHHKACGNVWEMSPSSILRGSKCSNYACSHRKSPQTFKKEFYERLGNGYKLLTDYERFDSPIKVYHEICGFTYTVTPAGVLSGTKCPECARIKRTKTPEEYKEAFLATMGEDYVLLSEYSLGNEKVKVLHKTCGKTYKVRAKNIYQGARCPRCKESHGERKIANKLETLGLKFQIQKKFPDCKAIYPLPFDFYLPDYNLLIEYDGEQHFRPVEFFGGVEAYHRRLKYDSVKTEYCKANSYRLIRISYKDFNNIDSILDGVLL